MNVVRSIDIIPGHLTISGSKKVSFKNMYVTPPGNQNTTLFSLKILITEYFCKTSFQDTENMIHKIMKQLLYRFTEFKKRWCNTGKQHGAEEGLFLFLLSHCLAFALIMMT